MRAAALDRLLKSANGITGCLANFHCERKKNTNSTIPRIMRQSTIAEVQGKFTPPNPRPTRSSSVAAVTVEAPSQSMAFRPAISGVFGVWTSRKTNRMMKAIPSQGTHKMISETLTDISSDLRFRKKHHRQLTLSVKAPPITGPIADASAQVAPIIAKYKPRSLPQRLQWESIQRFQERDLPQAYQITNNNIR